MTVADHQPPTLGKLRFSLRTLFLFVTLGGPASVLMARSSNLHEWYWAWLLIWIQLAVLMVAFAWTEMVVDVRRKQPGGIQREGFFTILSQSLVAALMAEFVALLAWQAMMLVLLVVAWSFVALVDGVLNAGIGFAQWKKDPLVAWGVYLAWGLLPSPLALVVFRRLFREHAPGAVEPLPEPEPEYRPAQINEVQVDEDRPIPLR